MAQREEKGRAEELLKRVREYAYDMPSYLSSSTDYAKGYRDGCYVVKKNLQDILSETYSNQ